MADEDLCKYISQEESLFDKKFEFDAPKFYDFEKEDSNPNSELWFEKEDGLNVKVESEEDYLKVSGIDLVPSDSFEPPESAKIKKLNQSRVISPKKINDLTSFLSTLTPNEAKYIKPNLLPKNLQPPKKVQTTNISTFNKTPLVSSSNNIITPKSLSSSTKTVSSNLKNPKEPKIPIASNVSFKKAKSKNFPLSKISPLKQVNKPSVQPKVQTKPVTSNSQSLKTSIASSRPTQTIQDFSLRMKELTKSYENEKLQLQKLLSENKKGYRVPAAVTFCAAPEELIY